MNCLKERAIIVNGRIYVLVLSHIEKDGKEIWKIKGKIW